MKDQRIGRVKLTTKLARIGDRLPVIGHIRRTRTRKSNVLRGLGIILFWIALLSLIPFIPALIHHENVWPFVITFAVAFVASLILIAMFGASKVYHHTDGTLMVILLWISLFIIGAIPYVTASLMGSIHCEFIDAIFESVSGFTTVGASIFDRPEDLPISILVWRVLTQWIGGIIIVLLFMVILPMFVPGRRSLAKNDLQPLTDADGVQMKTIDVAKQFIIVYLVLTAIFSILIFIAAPETNIENAVMIALSTISIGGFAPTSDSLTNLNALQKILVAFMMIISATNFYLHFRLAVKRELGIYLADTEFKAMIIWYAILTLGIFLILKDKFVDGFFMIISMATTTGFVSDASFATWKPAALLLIALGMFIGGSSGSPAGGIKLSRVLIILKSIVVDAYEVVNSSIVQVPKLNGKPIDERKVHNAYAVLTLFIIVTAISTVVYSVCPTTNGVVLTPQQSLFTAISMISATGTTTAPAFAASYVTMSLGVKIYTCFLMVFARMEIIALLAIFMPKFWSEVSKNSSGIRKDGNDYLDKIHIRK